MIEKDRLVVNKRPTYLDKHLYHKYWKTNPGTEIKKIQNLFIEQHLLPQNASQNLAQKSD